MRHEKLILALAAQYEAEGYRVEADHVTYPGGAPPIVNGHRPDVAAYCRASGRLAIIAEAETCDTIDDDETQRQWLAFGKSLYDFDIIVPRECLARAKLNAWRWGVRFRKFWFL